MGSAHLEQATINALQTVASSLGGREVSNAVYTAKADLRFCSRPYLAIRDAPR